MVDLLVLLIVGFIIVGIVGLLVTIKWLHDWHEEVDNDLEQIIIEQGKDMGWEDAKEAHRYRL